MAWIVAELNDTDIVACARQVQAERLGGASQEQSLEQQADEFLRSHGVNPRRYHTPVKFQPYRR